MVSIKALAQLSFHLEGSMGKNILLSIQIIGRSNYSVFSNESTLHMRWPKYWSFSFSIIPSKEIPGFISLRMDWLGLLAVQGTLRSLLQHHSSKASILWCSAFFTVQLSHPYATTGKTREAWCAAIHGVTKSRTWLSDRTELTELNYSVLEWLTAPVFFCLSARGHI